MIGFFLFSLVALSQATPAPTMYPSKDQNDPKCWDNTDAGWKNPYKWDKCNYRTDLPYPGLLDFGHKMIPPPKLWSDAHNHVVIDIGYTAFDCAKQYCTNLNKWARCSDSGDQKDDTDYCTASCEGVSNITGGVIKETAHGMAYVKTPAPATQPTDEQADSITDTCREEGNGAQHCYIGLLAVDDGANPLWHWIGIDSNTDFDGGEGHNFQLGQEYWGHGHSEIMTHNKVAVKTTVSATPYPWEQIRMNDAVNEGVKHVVCQNPWWF